MKIENLAFLNTEIWIDCRDAITSYRKSEPIKEETSRNTGQQKERLFQVGKFIFDVRKFTLDRVRKIGKRTFVSGRKIYS